MPMCTPLGENRILLNLPPGDLAEIQPFLKRVPFAQGRVLYSPDTEIEHFWFPLSGLVSLLTVLESGDQIEHGIVGRSGLVGATSATNGSLAAGQAMVQISGEAFRLPRATFMSMYERSAALRRLTNEYNGLLYFQAIQSGACHAVHAVEARLCRWLLQSQDVLDSTVVDLTQESLAHMLGLQRSAVSLCAQKLQASGLIDYSRGSIKIINRGGLQASACECYHAIRRYTDHMKPPIFSN